MKRVPTHLTFRLEQIPAAQQFAGLVRVTADGFHLDVDSGRVGGICIRLSHTVNAGLLPLQVEYADGTEPPDPEDLPPDPYVTLTVEVGDLDEALSWYWGGDGSYDGWCVPMPVDPEPAPPIPEA